MNRPRISILLPTWNGEGDLRRLLPALAAQSLASECEVLAIDSSSSDGSQRLLEEARVRVEVIPQEQFGHAKTRNRLAAMARGEFLVFLSQDALPLGKDFLGELLAPLAQERVAGSYARIVPHPGDDALTARTVAQAPEARDQVPARALLEAPAIWQLSGAERVEHLRFNNVASAVRAQVFDQIEFPEVPFGEDFAWAARVIGAGWRVCFAPRSIVQHAHRYSARQAFERYRLDAAFHREIHGHLLRPGWSSALRGIIFELRADLRFVASRKGRGWRDLWRSPALRSAQVLGQLWGSRGWGEGFWPAGQEQRLELGPGGTGMSGSAPGSGR